MCGRWVPPAAKADGPSNAIKAEDSNKDSSEGNNEAARSDTDNSSVIPVTAVKASNPETIVSTEPPLAIPSQYNPLADGLSGVPTKETRTVNTVEREVFLKQLANIVHTSLRTHMVSWFDRRKSLRRMTKMTKCYSYQKLRNGVPKVRLFKFVSESPKHLRKEKLRRKSFSWPPSPHQKRMSAEIRTDLLELNLIKWRTKNSTCGRSDETCSPCLNKEQCISITSRELFKEITDEEIGNICKFYKLVFLNSVCTVTNLDLGEEMQNLTPPWGVLGLGYSLRDFSFNLSNYLSHHALGTPADQLVRKGMLDAATAGGEDRRKHGEADQGMTTAMHMTTAVRMRKAWQTLPQQHQAVEAKPE